MTMLTDRNNWRQMAQGVNSSKMPATILFEATVLRLTTLYCNSVLYARRCRLVVVLTTVFFRQMSIVTNTEKVGGRDNISLIPDQRTAASLPIHRSALIQIDNSHAR